MTLKMVTYKGGFLYFFLFVTKARGWLENVYVGDFDLEVG
jgi:hypothetical protein